MTSMAFDENTAQSMLYLIEDNKDKLTEGDYLKLCNASKFIYEQSKLIEYTYEVETEPEPGLIRNPFWKTGPDWGLKWVPARRNYTFTPTADEIEINKLECEIRRLEFKMRSNKKELKKKHRVRVSDKYNVLLRLLNEHELDHQTPYDVKSMTDKISYHEKQLKMIGVAINKNDYVIELNTRISFNNDYILKENEKHKKEIKDKKRRLIELRE